MIPQLETWIADVWDTLAPHRPRPRQLHIAKFSLEDYPPPSAAMLFLAFADDEAKLVAVAKVARIPDGDATVEREAFMLEQVRAQLPKEFLELLPRPVESARLNDRAALLMTACRGEVEMHHTWGARASKSTPQIEAAIEWIDRLAMATASGERSAGDWLGGTPEEAVSQLAKLGCNATALELVKPRLAALWPMVWPCGLAHGDFFPGNLLFGPGAAGRSGWQDVAVVDWMLAELEAPGFFDPLLYELSFSTHALRGGASQGANSLRMVNAWTPFVETRRRWLERGIDTGLGSPARLATLVHAALRDASFDPGRRVIAGSWMRLLEMELAVEAAAPTPRIA